MACTGTSTTWYGRALLVGAVFMFFLQKCWGLWCWECNSKYDPNCGEPFKNHTIALVDCNQRFLQHYPNMPGKICRKLTQKVQGEKRIVRSCGFLESGSASAGTECINRAGTHQVFMQYCQCSVGDGCNSANDQNALHFMVYAILSASVLLHRIL